MQQHPQSAFSPQAERLEARILAACLILATVAITLRASELAGLWGLA